MKISYFVPFGIVCMLSMAFTNGPQKDGGDKNSTGINLNNLDRTAKPGTDFYQFACGGWMKAHPLTAEYSRFGSFDMLGENNRAQLNGLIVGLANNHSYAHGSLGQKIGDLYNMAMDSVKLNKDGNAPLRNDLRKVSTIRNRAEVYALLGDMLFYADPFFNLYVGADDKNSTANLLQCGQGGLGMGERDYYLEQTDKMKDIRAKYVKFITKMFTLAGYNDAYAKEASAWVMDIETRLAKVARKKEDLRDPYKNYNKMTIAAAKAKWPAFGWSALLSHGGLTAAKEINVGQPESITEISNIIAKLPMKNIIAYLQWNIINGGAGELSDDFVDANFDFYGRTMSGRQQNNPRWKRAVSAVTSALGEAVGKMYVEKYFPAAAKERMLQLVKNLQKSLAERIQAQEWMSAETKTKALEKLAAFRIKVGYPDKWKDYSKLDIVNDSYYENMKRAGRWAYNRMVDKLGKPVDPTEWMMTPQTVNAYYNPTTNEICFPAGILQYPFFDMNADDAFNYGAIGVVIGHEMTHGFDDEGRQYNKDGNLQDWWSKGDGEKFNARTKVMSDFFNNITVAPGIKANGLLTLGENLADHGGLQVSYNAFLNATKDHPLTTVDGFTPAQRFFLAYANVWAGNIRPQEILKRTKTDPHALGKWRVDGALPHIQAWYEAFGITPSDPMYVPADKRVNIW
jgi:putative endopeptidase